MSLEVVHRDFKIHYAENRDVWECYDLSLEAPTLSKLKDKVNRFVQKLGKKVGLPAYFQEHRSGSTLTKCMVVSAPFVKKEMDWDAKGYERIVKDIDYVWIAFDYGQTKKRRQERLGNLFPDSDETRAAMEAIALLHSEERRLEERRNVALGQMTRMKPSDISGLKPDEPEA